MRDEEMGRNAIDEEPPTERVVPFWEKPDNRPIQPFRFVVKLGSIPSYLIHEVDGLDKWDKIPFQGVTLKIFLCEDDCANVFRVLTKRSTIPFEVDFLSARGDSVTKIKFLKAEIQGFEFSRLTYESPAEEVVNISVTMSCKSYKIIAPKKP